MPIALHEPLPDATLYESTTFGAACPRSPEPVSVRAQLSGKRVVLFGLPGAFTPTCSTEHVPGYLRHLDALRAKGVGEVWCVSVNDGFVMAAWGQQLGATGRVRMLGDGSAELARKLGLVLDLTAEGMGVRMERFSLLAVDGVVQRLFVEPGDTFGVSSAEAMLASL
jgi:peroxiredoxin